MSTFDIRTDAPGLLRVEALSIQLTFKRTGPTTGRVSWNIPMPAAGCAAGTQAYCGMLVELSTSPLTTKNTPVDGTVYSADSTADINLFAGDKIGNALIIGAFYEDHTTTQLDVSGLDPVAAYYVGGFPMDCQHRYFADGVYAYSQTLAQPDVLAGTSGYQIVQFNQPGGVQATDLTGLVGGLPYTFSVKHVLVPPTQIPVSYLDCPPSTPTYNVAVNGSESHTFGDLVTELNHQFALLTSPYTGTLPPLQGSLYYNPTTHVLNQWSGYGYVAVSVILSATDPIVVPVGTYWLDAASVLHVMTLGGWVVKPVLHYATDPTQIVCDTVWVDPVSNTVYIYNGTTWCIVPADVTVIDPSTVQPALCGALWVHTNTYSQWSTEFLRWDAIDPAALVISAHDPNTLPIGYHWFDPSTETLFVATSISPTVWSPLLNVAITAVEPLLPAPGKFWVNPTTMVVKQWDIVSPSVYGWVVIPTAWAAADPTTLDACSVWFQTATAAFMWDVIHADWIPVDHVYNQLVDPSVQAPIVEGTYWLDPSTHILYKWTNGCYVVVNAIVWGVPPNELLIGTVWYNGVVYQILTGSGWALLQYTASPTDPSIPILGAYWYNTATNALSMWNGASWVPLMFSTTPHPPATNSYWFNGTQLLQWNGNTWVIVVAPLTAELDCNGNLKITNTVVGSPSLVDVSMNPDGTIIGNLFQSLTPPGTLTLPRPGSDAVPVVPMSEQRGVGTDGSNDERLQLMNEIRYALGYPQVGVELSVEQLDQCITRALEELRLRSDVAYKSGYFSMAVQANIQKYRLTNQTLGYNRIVSIMGIYRMTSAFASSAHGAGVYGQQMLQQLYNMGTFDMLSYHIMSEYTELMEILFATRLTFTFDEHSRVLHILSHFPQAEPRVLIEATVERPEQELLQDRWSKPWLRRWAMALAREMLAETRGKFAALPGAGGSVTMNAQDLRQAAKDDFDRCLADIDDYVVTNIDNFGAGVHMILG